VGGNTCACKAGYTGPTCEVPLCVQTCVHGVCKSPDTCLCNPGWFDANCTTPVCSVTCGNGGNCTNPERERPCTCPSEWAGDTCREPVCARVTCVNGGSCVAPDTCLCPPGWSGHDCSKPVCSQGYFRPDPQPTAFAPASFSNVTIRPLTWKQYVAQGVLWAPGVVPRCVPLLFVHPSSHRLTSFFPGILVPNPAPYFPPPPLHSRYLPCNITEWCIATNDFDCQQAQRRYLPAPTNLDRTVTGFDAYGDPALGACFRFELADFYLTAYRCALWDNTPTVLLCCCAVVLLCCCAAVLLCCCAAG
jgi:hypothetical protein